MISGNRGGDVSSLYEGKIWTLP